MLTVISPGKYQKAGAFNWTFPENASFDRFDTQKGDISKNRLISLGIPLRMARNDTFWPFWTRSGPGTQSNQRVGGPGGSQGGSKEGPKEGPGSMPLGGYPALAHRATHGLPGYTTGHPWHPGSGSTVIPGSHAGRAGRGAQF